ncbi:MAG: hypothetical protein V4597_10525 [Pseudomonadota bacterium]
MSLTPPIQVRLTPHIHAHLQAEAADRGLSVSEVIRQRLEASDPTLAAINGLRGDLAFLNPDLAQRGGKPRGYGVLGPDWVDLEGLLVEVLYILRLTRMEEAHKARAEIELIGLPTYQIGKGR